MASSRPIVIRPAHEGDTALVCALLEASGLPVLGVDSHVREFFVAADGDGVVGTIGLEVYGADGLLRSAAVAETHRNQGLGSSLVDRVLLKARELRLRKIFLLTNTAEDYFRKKGFRKVERETVTGSITGSAEFLLPPCTHAACMEMTLPAE